MIWGLGNFVGGGHARDLFFLRLKNRRHGRLPQVLIFLVATFSVQADYQTGLNAYSNADYQTAMQEWLEVTEQPPAEVNPYIYAETHYAIARLYWQGQGTQQDFDKVREWLEKAAALNHAGAMGKLGYLYTDGVGVQQDFDQAFEWFNRAARLGDVDALYNLGIFYLNGWGVEADRTMAKQYLAAASAQGDPDAEQAYQQLQAADEAEVLKEITPSVVAKKVVAQESNVVVGGGHARDSLDAEKTDRGHGPLPQKPEPEPEPEKTSQAFVFQTEPWIETRNPEHYTLQVIGLTNIEDLKSLVEGHESHTPWAIYTIQRSSGPLYILTQGDYATVEEARVAKAAFPFRVSRRDEVWIRKFEMIHKAMGYEPAGGS